MPETVEDIASLFAHRPWRALPEDAMAATRDVPSMLSREEKQLYCWLAAHWATGAGEIVDLGAFAGGSTARLAEGLARAGRPGLVHAYDRFTADADNRARHLYPSGIPRQADDDILPLVHRILAPWDQHVTFHVGDILDKRWTGEPVELLVVDLAKTAAAADHVAQEFFPALIPGRSVVVHQDFALRVTPWLPAQMMLLADHFVPLVHCRRDSVVFLCTRPVTRAQAEAARTETLRDATMERLLRAATVRFGQHLSRYRFSQQIRAVRDNPGGRASWQMWRKRPAPK
jgi:hypothetical protein